jgi:hypothetical protein
MSTDKTRGSRSGTDADGILAALRRARGRAERLALATGTCLVVEKEGKPVRVPPRPDAATGAREEEPAWK